MNLINTKQLSRKLSVSASWVHNHYDALPHVILGNNNGIRKQIRFDWFDVARFLNSDETTSILLTPSQLARKLNVSKSWIQKNYKTIPHIILPNNNKNKRKLIRFNYDAVIAFLKGGNDHE